MLLLICCTTTQIKNETTLDLNFPEVPDSLDKNGNPIIQYDSETKIVSMPLYYWLNLTDYIINIQQEEKIYKQWKEN